MITLAQRRKGQANLPKKPCGQTAKDAGSMLYLDTSAFLKLYVLEEGSEAVQNIVVGQHDPLPVLDVLEMEFTNAIWLKVFWSELRKPEAVRLLGLFEDRRKRGLYFTPELSRSRLLDRFRALSEKTQETGCRTMDVLHVAAAIEIGAKVFVSFDDRQRRLAKLAGLTCQPLKLK